MLQQFETYMTFVDVKPSSKATYRKALDSFSRFVQDCDCDLSELNHTDILNYKEGLLADNKSPQTVNLYLTVVRGFYRWAVSERILERDITAEIKSVRTNKDTFRKMHLESYQGARLLDEVSTPAKVKGVNPGVTEKLNGMEEVIALRNFAMVNLMLRTGLRTIEVHRADVGDITFRKDRRILKVWGKGHSEKDAFVILTDAAYKPLQEYLALRPNAQPNEPLFCTAGFGHEGERVSTRTIQNVCKTGLRAIGLDSHEYSAHSLRHTTGTEILLKGGNMFDVQAVLRHASPATSQLYVNTVQEDVRLDQMKEQLLDGSFNQSEIPEE